LKRGLIQNIHNRASAYAKNKICLMNNLRRDLQLSGYPQSFTDSIINSEGRSHPNKGENPMGSVCNPCVNGFSEKLKNIGNKYNVRTILRTKNTLRC
jgi:hypothetical protein